MRFLAYSKLSVHMLSQTAYVCYRDSGENCRRRHFFIVCFYSELNASLPHHFEHQVHRNVFLYLQVVPNPASVDEEFFRARAAFSSTGSICTERGMFPGSNQNTHGSLPVVTRKAECQQWNSVKCLWELRKLTL